MALFSRQLIAFMAVAEELHFGRAAQRLHVSQPPLSQQVRLFEERVGVPLIERSTRTVRLTAAGLALPGMERRQAELRGHSRPVTVLALKTARDLPVEGFDGGAVARPDREGRRIEA